jgi:hypothetical protein
MKLRTGHIATIIICIVAAAIAFIVMKDTSTRDSTGSEEGAGPPSRDEEFLAEVRREAEAVPLTEGVGNVSPEGVDANMVPIIEVETNAFSMGVISHEEPTSRPLKVFNRGRLPLKIYNITTSCACTQGSIPESESIIDPGDEGIITVTVDPYRIPGFVSEKVLTISSNDPNTTQVQVKVHADVDPEFVLIPEGFDFGEVKKGAEPTKTVRFRQVQEAPINITAVNSFGNRSPSEAAKELILSYEQVPEEEWAEPGKREYDIHATLSPETPAGELQRRVYMISDLPRVVAMQIPLRATVVAPYQLDPIPPQQVIIKGGENQVGTATVTSESTVAIDNVEVPEGVLIATVRPVESPQTAHLDISLDPAAPVGAIQESVTFDILVGQERYRERVNVRSFKVAAP